jgi:hypothetical protein
VTGSGTPSAYGAAVTFTATIAVTSPGTGTPTGTVNFKDGATVIASGVALSGNTATFTTTTALTGGAHTITAVYSGDTNFKTSTSGNYTQTVTKATQATSLSGSGSPTSYGTPVTFTASVGTAAGGVTPTGNVAFKDGATTIATIALSGGSASYTTSTLTAATHSITAVYAGDTNYNTTTSSVVSQVVTKVTNTPALSSSVNPSAAGISVSFTASVALAGSGNFATGNVTFKDGATTLGTVALSSGSATYSTSTLSITTHSITAVYAGDTNYNTATSGAVSQVVTKATSTPVVTSSANPSTYAGSVTLTATVSKSGTAAVPTGSIVFKDGVTTLGTVTLSAGSATYTTSAFNASAHSITAAYNGDANYNAATSAGFTQTVNPATLTVTANDKTMNYGGTTPTFTYTPSGFVNGDTSAVLSGAPSLTSTGNSTTGAGTYPITPAAGSLAASNYTFNFVNGTLTINPVPLTLTADDKAMTYGGAAPALTLHGVGFVNGDTAASLSTPPALSTTTTAAGSFPITVSGAASPNYSPISYQAGTMTVSKAPLTIAADGKSMVYGSSVPALTYTPSGFVGSDTASVLTGSPSLSTTAVSTSGAGNYPITLSAGTLAASNYLFTFINATLTANPAPLTITADNKTMTYGGTAPALTASYSGFVNGDTAASLTSPAALSTTTNVAGSFPISVNGAASPNYSINFQAGTMTVNPAPLSIRPVDATMVYGGPMPSFSYTATGFVNGDTAASLGVQPTLTPGASVSSAAGSYSLIASGAASPNYNISYQPASLTVTKAPLSVTPDNQTKVFRRPNPVLTGIIAGIRNSDPITATYTTTAVLSSPGGSYPITVAAVSDGGTGALSNYNVTLNTGTLTVQTPSADMIESGVSFTGSPLQGQNIVVYDTTANQGGVDAGGSYTFFYLSTDGATKGAQLGMHGVPALLAGASSTSSGVSVQVPYNLSGVYYVLACADGSNSIVENNKANNCTATAPFTVAGADLIETGVSVVGTPVAGGSIQVTDTTLNQGGGAANTSATFFYLSKTTTGGTTLGYRWAPGLAAGANSAATTSLTLPLSISGTYYIVVCADGSNGIVESNKANNCTASAPFTLAGADLIETGVSVVGTPVAGGSIQVTDTTVNQGGGAASTSATFFYLSKTTSGGTTLGYRWAPGLTAGSNSSATTSLTLPLSISGTYYIVVCADGSNGIVESNKANNCTASAPFTVAGADLVETGVSVVGTPVAGGSIQVTDTTVNQGGGAASSSATFFYLSNTTTGGTTLGYRWAPGLTAGANSAATTSLTLPAGIIGTYYIVVCADGSNGIVEGNKANNCTASAPMVITH